jgi:dienelactone hydrolase
MTDLTKLKGPIDWLSVRGEIESALLGMLGKIPRERVDLEVNSMDEVEGFGYVRHKVNYFVDDWTRVSAWLFVPDIKEEVPGILCCHQQSSFAKNETAGMAGDVNLALAKYYAERGYVTLAPDCITAGERVSSRLEPYDSATFYKDFPKMAVAGKMLVDHAHAIEVLTEHERVDSARIGVVGHGLGAFNALILAALDERVVACVASCGFERFATDKKPKRWAPDEGLVLMPKIRDLIKDKAYTFDWEHVIALAAPTATLIVTSLADSIYSNPKSCSKAVTQAKKVYKVLGASGALDHYTHHDGHTVRPETLDVMADWFERWL